MLVAQTLLHYADEEWEAEDAAADAWLTKQRWIFLRD
jgi:hypothetical protein